MGANTTFLRTNFRITGFVREGFRFSGLPFYTQQKLLCCPDAGNGVHLWLYHCACLLHEAGVTTKVAVELLERAASSCDRDVPSREIEEAVYNSADAQDLDLRVAKDGGRRLDAKRPRPTKNYSLIEKIARAGGGLAALDATDGQPPPASLRPADVLSKIFPMDCLVCCGWAKDQFKTQPLSHWLRTNLERTPFVVPSPMSSLFGLSQKGTKSSRCLANVGPRRFLVIEFDFKEKNKHGEDTPDAAMLRSLASDGINVADLGVSLHLHLATLANLVKIVHSGNKSQHGWYFADGESEEKISKLMRYAVSLGADPMTQTPCQLVRMPGAFREGTETRQIVRYFEPGRIAS